MFFRYVLGFLLVGIIGLYADESQNQKRQVYMLKGQLYEQEQKVKLAEISEQKNGFFIGAILGNINLKSTPAGYQNLHPLLYGFRGGYQKYLRNYIAGLRFYAEYLRGDMKNADYQLGSVNLDLLADIPLNEDKAYSLGAFAGVGMAWTAFNQKSVGRFLNQLGTTINLGIALSLNLKHRIELSMKIPPVKLQEEDLREFSSTNLYLISYNFLF
ncbi:outer membrane beta-barrel protein [Helicobacter sp. 13S00477-4]|uniref:outer membrane beta-barrel protein n=1 Tax=Helicobacter sp. 13S00477-4 TaxID=1905759 RepID=UPI000BA5081D|nr:outer membrane beta-barrel protein [Helicobacter sp. 13S00477-4]PAF51584.1 hypothetical protein BKH44_05040 [Helicobacter sp. 13S00477-4]